MSSEHASVSNGNTMEQIYRRLSEWELKNFPEIIHSKDHTVLFKMPLSTDPTVLAQPYKGHLKWDSHNVRLPCAPQSQYPVSNTDGTEDIKDRWTLICDALDHDIMNSKQLESAILSYNAKYSKTWRFRALHKLFEEMSDEGHNHFFQSTLPSIIRLAVKMPDLIKSSIPLLKCNMNASVSLSQQQIASLLANAFLCTYPRRNTQKKNSEYRTFPDINFNRLFASTERQVIEKIKCIIHYFQRIITQMPTGVVTVTRRCMSSSQMPDWSNCTADFSHSMIHVTAEGTVEDQGRGLLQVDFANKYLGGGVLGRGCVQEEIRFVICPELFITKLIVEVLQPNEALFVIGCERYSSYIGYASSFAFEGEFIDDTPVDDSRRRLCTIVALDAMNFHTSTDQYREELMRRELNKAFVGYSHWLNTPAPAVATGNWGCGAFGGDKRLKALLQLIVCTVTLRPMVYFTFGDHQLQKELLDLYYFLRRSNINVAQLWAFLKIFRKYGLPSEQLYFFIRQAYQDSVSSSNLQQSQPPKQQTGSSAASTSVPCSPCTNTKSIDSYSFYNKTPSKMDNVEATRMSSNPSKIHNINPTGTQSSLLIASLDNHYFNPNSSVTTAENVKIKAENVIREGQREDKLHHNYQDAESNRSLNNRLEYNHKGESHSICEPMAPGSKNTTTIVEEDEVIPGTPPQEQQRRSIELVRNTSSVQNGFRCSNTVSDVDDLIGHCEEFS